MIGALGWGLLGLLLLALGGETVVKGVSGLAQRWGLSAFRAGLLLMAVATSLPEAAVNLQAVWNGVPALALGNAVGSSIVNLGLTLGLAAICAPLLVRARLLSPLLLVLIGVSALLVVLGLDGTIGSGEGAGLLLVFVLAMVWMWRRASSEPEDVREALAQAAISRTVLWLNVVRMVLAIFLLGYGARYVLLAAQQLGEAWALTPLMTGLLPVAIATALPEAAAAIVAARRGQGDMVLGHVLGSSVFNLTLIIGGMAVAAPLAVPASFVRLELPAAIALAVVLYPMLRGDLRISRGEGAVLLLAFCAWVALEVAWLR
ncbi:MAG: sodium:calcium antiporter [Pseudoxanthomonas sp.]